MGKGKKLTPEGALDCFFNGWSGAVSYLEFVAPEDKEKAKKMSMDIQNCKRRDIMSNKKEDFNTVLKEKDSKRTKAHYHYSLDEYLKAYDPVKMYEISERMKLRGLELRGYGTEYDKYIGDYVRIQLTEHILEGRFGTVIACDMKGYLVRSNYRNKPIDCYFKKDELRKICRRIKQ